MRYMVCVTYWLHYRRGGEETQPAEQPRLVPGMKKARWLRIETTVLPCMDERLSPFFAYAFGSCCSQVPCPHRPGIAMFAQRTDNFNVTGRIGHAQGIDIRI